MEGARLNPTILGPSFGARWLPESSRWLLLHGRSQLAVQNLRKVAVMNGRVEEGERLTKEVGTWVEGGGTVCWPLDGPGLSSFPGRTHHPGEEGRVPVRQTGGTTEWLCDRNAII